MVIIATIQTIKEEQQFIMPVFDFSNSKTEKKDPECTYTTFQSNEKVPSPEKPTLIIENKSRQLEASFLWCLFQSKPEIFF